MGIMFPPVEIGFTDPPPGPSLATALHTLEALKPCELEKDIA